MKEKGIIEETKSEKSLSIYVPASLFALAIVFAVFGSPISVLMFIASIFTLCYKLKQMADNFNKVAKPGTGTATLKKDDRRFTDDALYTADINSTSSVGGSNYGDDF